MIFLIGNAIIMQTNLQQEQPDPVSITTPITTAYNWANTVEVWFAAAFLAVSLIAYVLYKSSD